MLIIVLGFSAPNASANCSTHEKGINYNELSPAEFFYGVSIENMNDTVSASGGASVLAPVDKIKAAAFPTDSEFFYGYSIPSRLNASDNYCTWKRTDSINNVSEVSNPAIFFGYADEAI